MKIDGRLKQTKKNIDDISSGAGGYEVKDGNPSSSRGSGEVGLREFCETILDGKWTIICTTLIFSVLSIFYVLSLPNIYKSDVLLAPVEEKSSGGFSSQLGGLASLTGMSFGGSSDNTTLALEVLKSRQFIMSFIQTHQLLVPLMASTGWNKDRDELNLDSRLYDLESGGWLKSSGYMGSAKPSWQDGYKQFMKQMRVSQDKMSNYVNLSFEHYSPVIAKEWVDLLVQDINLEIKKRDLVEAQKSIKYLTEQLGKTTVADLRQVFYELIEEQSKTIMLANVRDEYVFSTIDKALVPEEKKSPNRSVICLLVTFAGAFFAFCFCFVRKFFGLHNF